MIPASTDAVAGAAHGRTVVPAWNVIFMSSRAGTPGGGPNVKSHSASPPILAAVPSLLQEQLRPGTASSSLSIKGDSTQRRSRCRSPPAPARGRGAGRTACFGFARLASGERSGNGRSRQTEAADKQVSKSVRRVRQGGFSHNYLFGRAFWCPIDHDEGKQDIYRTFT